MSVSSIKWNKTNRIRIDNITIPTNSSITIDLSSYVPSGQSIYSVTNIYLGGYPLPYIEYDTDASAIKMTWVAFLNAKTKTLTISNRASAWNNFSLYADIIFS